MHTKTLSLEFEITACPICGGRHHAPLANQDRYGFGLTTVLCECCGFVFTNPMPQKKSLDNFYSHGYRLLYRKSSGVDTTTLVELGVPQRVAATYSYISKSIDFNSSAAVLDFGSADGSLLKYIKERHPQLVAYGVEPSVEYRNFSQKSVQAVLFADIKDLPPMLRFDFISLNHVLEHLIEPVEFLRQLIRYLNEGGALYIDVPNLMAYRSYDDLHLAHVGHYTNMSLKNLAAILGLHVVHVEEYRPVNHPASIRCVAIKSNKFQGVVPLSDVDKKHITEVFNKILRGRFFYKLMKVFSGFISVGRLRRLVRRAHLWLRQK